MELETEWAAHPVIRLDMSGGGETETQLCDFFDWTFSVYEAQYGVSAAKERDLTGRFADIIQAAARQTGRQAVILIDEYDSPLLHSWGSNEYEKCTAIYRSVFSVLKSAIDAERFVFITGITKLTQISLFSVLNNLTDLSFMPAYATICGMTRDEILATFKPEIETLAEKDRRTVGETMDDLRDYYDGYHFSRQSMADVYNPFSVVQALAGSDISNYWASSGATAMLPKFVTDIELQLADLDHSCIGKDVLESSDVTAADPEIFLYQCGYLE